MTPELIAIVPEEVFAVIKIKVQDVAALYKAMDTATVLRNPADLAPHEAFMGFHKFIGDLLESLKKE